MISLAAKRREEKRRETKKKSFLNFSFFFLLPVTLCHHSTQTEHWILHNFCPFNPILVTLTLSLDGVESRGWIVFFALDSFGTSIAHNQVNTVKYQGIEFSLRISSEKCWSLSTGLVLDRIIPSPAGGQYNWNGSPFCAWLL